MASDPAVGCVDTGYLGSVRLEEVLWGLAGYSSLSELLAYLLTSISQHHDSRLELKEQNLPSRSLQRGTSTLVQTSFPVLGPSELPEPSLVGLRRSCGVWLIVCTVIATTKMRPRPSLRPNCCEMGGSMSYKGCRKSLSI